MWRNLAISCFSLAVRRSLTVVISLRLLENVVFFGAPTSSSTVECLVLIAAAVVVISYDIEMI